MVSDQAFLELIRKVKRLEHDLDRTKTKETTKLGGRGPGHCAMWGYNGVDNVVQTIIPNAAGDVTESITVMYSAAEITGADTGGGVTVLEPGDTFDLINDGVDVLTITCGGAGDLTIQRSAGGDTYKVILWMIWL